MQISTGLAILWRTTSICVRPPTAFALELQARLSFCEFLLARPVTVMPVVRENTRFLLAIKWHGGIIRRGVLDGLPGQIEQYLGFGPVDLINPLRSDDHLMSQPPIACINDDVSNRPGRFFAKKTLHVADITVARIYVISHDCVAATQMRIVVPM